MPETRIYKPGAEHLVDLLRQATAPEGAKLLIPDLQRPYRWRPDQVVRLLDSLIRGWPFGTLLLWKMVEKDVAEMPFRAFWKLVDRVQPDQGSTAGIMDPPVRDGYRMVLDGQQRLQSLVVALSGEGAFRLEDREWWASIDPELAKGRASKHWSLGALCLDLDDYARQRADKKVRVQHVDYTTALRWVVCAAKDGRSSFRKPANYEVPIDAQVERPGRFIRLSRLWDFAKVGAPPIIELMDTIRDELLPTHQVPKELADRLLNPILEVVLALGQVKQTEVSFLELQPMQSEGFDAEQYDEAIVNIFTRLNAGGSPLTDQEITFAWIKKYWMRESPEALEATPAFEKLQADLADKGIEIGIDRLVQTLSAIWAIIERSGRLLKTSDLVKGDKLKPLASGLSTRWRRLSENLIETAALLQELGLELGRHYESLNAFVALAAWRFIGQEWIAREKPKTVSEFNVESGLDGILRQRGTRFLLLTSWAGRWSGSSNAGFEKFATDLAEDHARTHGAQGDAVLESLSTRLSGWISDAIPSAVDRVQALQAGRRDDVRWYFVPLWVWHRLEAARREESDGINLPKKRTKPSTEVDHIVAHDLWLKRLASAGGPDEWENDVNQLGNCFLLQKNFNISKLNKPLGELLAQIKQFEAKDERRAWTELMDIPEDMVHPTEVELAALRELFAARTARIKVDLAAFVRDEKRLAEDGPLLSLSGKWTSEYLFQEKPVEAPMVLEQDGEAVSGAYGEMGRIYEARLEGLRLRGKWKEGAEGGLFEWKFDSSGRTFRGTWGMKSKSDNGGAWSGARREDPSAMSPAS